LKAQLHAKFEVADFICYGNIREFVFKNWDKLECGNTLFLLKKTLLRKTAFYSGKTGQINRLVYMLVVVFKHCTAPRKKAQEN